jgi:hypothetical protein
VEPTGVQWPARLPLEQPAIGLDRAVAEEVVHQQGLERGPKRNDPLLAALAGNAEVSRDDDSRRQSPFLDANVGHLEAEDFASP